jgi:hypothetical protein
LLKEAFIHKKRRASLEIYNTIVKTERKVEKMSPQKEVESFPPENKAMTVSEPPFILQRCFY